MARISGFRRFSYGCCLLFGVLHQVDAATRIPVTLPSVPATVAGSTTSSIASGTLSLGGTPLSGVFIEGATKNTPVRGILGGIDFSMPSTALKIKDTVKASSLVKGGLAALAAGAAFDELIKGIGWVMDQGQLVKPDPAANTPVKGTGASDYYWWSNATDKKYASAGQLCDSFGGTGWTTTIEMSGPTQAVCTASYPATGATGQVGMTRSGSTCPAGTAYSATVLGCVSTTAANLPVSDTDLDDIYKYVNSKQDAAWIKSLLQEMCANPTGGSSPDSCYRDLAGKRKILTGPASVQGPSTSTTSTTPNSDGTTSATTTTTSTNFGLSYGTDSVTSSPTVTTTTSTNGKPTNTTVTTDTTPEESTDDSTPDTATASPCTTNCDGPAYTTLYTKTTDTKEAAIDSYSSRVANLPILAAATGFFTVSASGGCPAWSVNTQFEVLQAVMPIDLVFDFHCQPWFTAVASFAKVVMSIVCAYLAFRQAFLD